MRRILSCLAALLFLCCGCQPLGKPGATTTTAKSSVTASVSATTTRPLYINGSLQTTVSGKSSDQKTPLQPGETRRLVADDTGRYDQAYYDRAIDYFAEIAGGAEFGEVAQGYVRKWQQPIRIAVTGQATSEDRTVIEGVVSQVNSLGLLPPVTILEDSEKANVTFIFDSLNNLKRTLPDYREDNMGMFFFQEQNFVIRQATIGIVSGLTDQKSRNHLIQEEFLQSLGLPRDSEQYPDSIFQQEWTLIQRPSDMDWLLLEMLYRPELSPGMPMNKAKSILHELYP